MGGEWRDTTLGDVIELKRGYDLPQRERKPGFVPLVSSSGVTDYQARPKVKGPGVVTGRYGTLGQVFFIPGDFWPLNTTLYIRDFKGNDPRFVSYFLRSLDFLAYSDKAAVPGINRNHLHQAEVRVPGDVSEQRRIASILGALDDKIELNRQMNRILEEMAQAIFTSWFIDFDGHDDLAESELGLIPRGWEVGPLGMLGELTIGGDWGQDEAFPGAVEASCLRGVDLEHLRRSGHASAPRRWLKQSSLERRAMDDRDVLVAGSGAGPTGRPLWMCADLLQALGPCVYSNFCKRIRCGTVAEAAYLDAWLHGMRESGETWEYVNGTSVPNLDANSLLSGKEIPMPPLPVLERYYDFVRPIWQKLYAGENGTLAALRDALLPRLISGEIRVPVAEEILEAGL